MFHEKITKRSFRQRVSQVREQCQDCGLVKGHCLCPKIQAVESKVKWVILSHEREMSRTSNTARLIEDCFHDVKNFVWQRGHVDKELMHIIEQENHEVYLVFPSDRQEEKRRLKKYERSRKKTVFLIVDGTWKEARKIMRKCHALQALPILNIDLNEKSEYFIRRNQDENHLCTAEVAIA